MNKSSHCPPLPAPLAAKTVLQFHDSRLAPDPQPLDEALKQPADLWVWIAENHHCNALLWQAEDRARRPDVPPEEIVASKRAIDKANQARNDAVEKTDSILLAVFAGIQRRADARLHSETAGAMIDRLSILALKIFHMRLQTLRHDVEAIHVAQCTEKLQHLILQRIDLAACLEDLLADIQSGRAYFKIYRQFKMYNDPAFNPYLK